jgi:hypothetical protein
MKIGGEMLELDHFAVAGETLDQAVAHVETALGVAMGPGGQHERYGTHNRLLGLDPALYMEAIAIDPQAPAPPDARWFGLDDFTGPARLDKWICRVPDMDAALEALPMAGRKVALKRGDLRWTMAVPEDGRLPFDGMFPALIEWHTDNLPGQRLAAQGRSLHELVICHPRAAELQALLAPLLTAPLVRFETADAPGVQAHIETGSGPVVLR